MLVEHRFDVEEEGTFALIHYVRSPARDTEETEEAWYTATRNSVAHFVMLQMVCHHQDQHNHGCREDREQNQEEAESLAVVDATLRGQIGARCFLSVVNISWCLHG